MGVGDLRWAAALAARNARRKLGDRAFPIGRAPIATRPSRWIPGNAGVPRGVADSPLTQRGLVGRE
jgi:hypothetical protein